MIKLKNIIAYFLLFLGIVIGIKTTPSVLHEFLNFFNIKNTISLDITKCLSYSIISNQFFYALFLFALFCILVGLLLLFRERKLTFKYNYFNIGFLIIFLILIYHSIAILSYIYLLMIEDNLFDHHIIYTIAFTISLCTNLLFLTLYSLIWFDKTLNNKIKLIFILILCSLSINICVSMLTFINIYGISNTEAGLNSDAFFEVFDFIINKLGIGILCMEENNPCKNLLINMYKVCDLSRDVNSIPRIPYAGGSLTFKWISRIMNTGVTISKYDTKKKCDKAREDYWGCMDFIRSEYKKNNKPK